MFSLVMSPFSRDLRTNNIISCIYSILTQSIITYNNLADIAPGFRW